MDLFLLRQIDGIADFDEVVEFVILADDEEHARLLASEQRADEGSACWLSESTSTCEKLSRKGQARVIVRHFKAG
jgi:hypothetical protein